MPLSLAPGHIRTGPFRLNLRANYSVYLAPGPNWRSEGSWAANGITPGARLLLKDKRRTTGSLRLEVDSHIDAVADVD